MLSSIRFVSAIRFISVVVLVAARVHSAIIVSMIVVKAVSRV